MAEFRIPERRARLLEYARSLTPPSGWKVEVSGDEIIMTAGPSVVHRRNLLLVRERFDAHRPAGMMPSENTDLASPNVGKLRNPDLTYIPVSAVELGGNDVPAEPAAVAVEIVSPSNPENDLIGKVRGYPLMHIPLYLLIDPRDGAIVLYPAPAAGVHRRRWSGSFGDLVPIPAPFAFDLATGDLVRDPL
ncbi:Uma2 family endonuclease [Kitasatospora sp. NBC_00240]|uniref:Uma2 family endonuclease n=1 Tax=Kitasatospora sp. NBC_00240 TaxID=2903567 RepID=UPI00225444B7|nr:Uma2 family endonuclease [Kitasatospora sp. NBC_00240]MCX5207760.1 Uma2 family endonuclease [Kitasatospora sp. NBC_00240]